MTGFCIKKSFFDGWDNLLTLMALNAAAIGVLFAGFFLADFFSATIPVSMLCMLASFLLEGIILTGMSRSLFAVASYKRFSWRELAVGLRETWLHGMLFSALVGVLALILSVAIRYYLNLGSLLGVFLALVLVWFAFVLVLSLQWFLPIRAQLDKRFFKCVRKCFLICFDNPGLSLFMFLYSVALSILSIFPLFLLPGVSGIVLAQNEAFRLLMYKYDWIELHPELEYRNARKVVPWEELLANDRETVGERSLKHFIFPWKD